MDLQSEYQLRRGLGVPRLSARRQAFVAAVRDAEAQQRDAGIDYDDWQVRQAAVHTREDLILAIAHLDEIAAAARSLKRWVLAGVVVLAAILVVLIR